MSVTIKVTFRMRSLRSTKLFIRASLLEIRENLTTAHYDQMLIKRVISGYVILVNVPNLSAVDAVLVCMKETNGT